MSKDYTQTHHCPIFVLGCIDFRFRDRVSDYIKSQHGDVDFDETLLAGGSKNLVDEQTRDVVLNQIRISHDLHQAQTVYLTNHIDCGAYGGSAAFSSKDEEVAKLTEDLKTSKQLVLEKYPDMEVKMLLLDWDSTEEIN